MGVLKFKTGIKPPHPMRFEEKIQEMIQVIASGEEMPPIVVLPTGRAITGSHRIEAYQRLGRVPPMILVTEREFDKLIRYIRGKYFNVKPKWVSIDICHELRQITDRKNLIKALSGQSAMQNTKGFRKEYENMDQNLYNQMIEGVVRWLIDYDGYVENWAFDKEIK